ncbi:DUF6950 family protein [Streptomyces sp. P17]|jgi:hypothetical protein|uniref:DUF6950 family protein n=1 Tax=Streptomyces sp. P17 TaxID=3074716 RepID=UPI0028F3F1F7|nr:hypothetical protein [Streptomyces sp. P17]MDT9701889.1 hypothetical protein [Streptomyces sp. P17]
MKLPDWQTRLTQYLIATAATPYRPGRHDCALWVAGAVETMTGQNLAPDVTYRTLDEGLTALHSLGFDDHVAFVADRFDEVHPAFGQPGDIAMVEGDLDQSLGLVLGETAGVLGLRGWGHVPMSQVKRVWRV